MNMPSEIILPAPPLHEYNTPSRELTVTTPCRHEVLDGVYTRRFASMVRGELCYSQVRVAFAYDPKARAITVGPGATEADLEKVRLVLSRTPAAAQVLGKRAEVVGV